MNGSQPRFEQAFQPPMREKDRAIATARRVLRGGAAMDLAEEKAVSRQLLRALCLAEVG